MSTAATLERVCTKQTYHHYISAESIRLMMEVDADSHVIDIHTIGLHVEGKEDTELSFVSSWTLESHDGKKLMFAGKWKSANSALWHYGVLCVEDDMHDELNRHISFHSYEELQRLMA